VRGSEAVTIDTDDRAGTTLLGYALEERVGAGGMGVVYRAHDVRLKRWVALKLVAPRLARDERFRERFLRETEAAASLEHPNVVPVHDAGEVDGQLYLAMRFVEGRDLRALLREDAPLAPARAIAIAAQVASALDAAHERGLVHRDVKPSNVLLDVQEHVYLADFGVAGRFADGVPSPDAGSLGTPAYVAPEQVEGGAVDGRADVYSLACLLYECLTGEPPFVRDSPLAVVWAHLEEQPPRASERNPALPAALDAVLARAMAKSAEERYATCGELVGEAAAALGLAAPAARRRLPLALAALGLLALAAALAAALVVPRGEAPRTAGAAPYRKALVAIDPGTNRIATVTRLDGDPYDAVAHGRTIWVYDWLDRTVSEVDAVTRDVRRRTPIATPDFDPGFVGPLVAADDSGAWVVYCAEGEPPRGTLTRIWPGARGRREHRLDFWPLAVAVGEGSVWVVGWRPAVPTLFRISPETGAVTGRVRLAPDAGGDSVAIGEGAVWVGDSRNAVLQRIDPRSLAVTGRVDLGTTGQRPVVGLGAVWVAVGDGGGRLLRVNPATLRVDEVFSSYATRSGTYAVGGGSLWWNDVGGGTVLRVDPATGRIVSTFRVTPTGPEGVGLMSTAIAVHGDRVWVAVGTGATG
jgi:hypothetical protein